MELNQGVWNNFILDYNIFPKGSNNGCFSKIKQNSCIFSKLLKYWGNEKKTKIRGRSRAMKQFLLVLHFPVLYYIDHVAHNEQTRSLGGENKHWIG